MSDRTAFLKETDALRDLRVLEAVEADPSVSQRELARELGVAVGVVNACVRALVRKGLVKVQGESSRSLSYHLTKPGVLHKSTLALQWTANTVDFYRQARANVAELLVGLASDGRRRAVVFGAAELAEITVLVAPGSGMDILAVIADGDMPLGDRIAGVPVLQLREASAGAPETGDVDLVLLSEDVSADQRAMLAARFSGAELFSLIAEPEGIEVPDEADAEAEVAL